MKKKFTRLYESITNRFINGGFLIGDIVKIKPDALKHKSFDGLEELKTQIKALMDSDLNIRVINVKNGMPAGMGANNTGNVNAFGRTLDIAQEIAPGRYYNIIAVPAEVVERNDIYPNLPPVPNSFKREDKSHINPKLAPNDAHNLDNKNTKIEFAMGAKPTTSMYLPKK